MIKSYFKLPVYIIAFVAAGAAAAFLVFQIKNFEKTPLVPSLAGKSISEASELLNERKLILKVVEHVNSDNVPEGHIIRQKVEPGAKIKAGTEVGVVVSLGAEIYSMPSFEGQPVEDAKLTLKNIGISIGKLTWVHSDTVEKGWIIAQRPLPGKVTGNEINFLVSLGPYSVSYRCPSFVNMTVDDAKALAGELGIKLAETGEGSRVIFQKPEAGALIRKGDSVEIKLGRGWGMWF